MTWQAIFTRIALLLALCSGPAVSASAQWQPSPDDSNELAAANALTHFREDPRLERYFSEAAGMAVFPTIVRAGFVVGVAHGRGLMIEGEQATGQIAMWEFIHGLISGGEAQRMIIFFQDAETIETFTKGNKWQFQGRAGASITVVGASIDPAFNLGIAVFVQTRGGLMLEATVAAGYYRFIPAGAE